MGEALAVHLADLRLFIFVGVLLVISLAERIFPFHKRDQNFWRRWFTNISLGAMSSILLRAMPAFAASIAAVFAERNSFGLFHYIQAPAVLSVTVSIIFLDLIIYIQHVLTHKIPLFWALHQVHHCDHTFDVTTGIRFHPIEIFLSMALKCLVVLAIGAPLLGVVLFEILLSSCALASHANLSLPSTLDRALRWLLVTPDMHRIHHSVHRNEHDSNYGTCTSIWDRLFRTYTAQASEAQKDINIGLTPYSSNKTKRLLWSLLLPFKGK